MDKDIFSPLATGLTVNVAADGKLVFFDFKVGEKIARVTLEPAALPEALNALMRALTAESLKAIPPKGLASGFIEAITVPLVEIGTSVEVFGETVTVDLELPAQAQIRFALTKGDAEHIQEALGDALAKIAERSKMAHH